MRKILVSTALVFALGPTPSVGQGLLERAYMTAPCYVRTTQRLTLRTGQPVPVGVDIGITADAGDEWLTTDENGLPRVAKTAAGRPDCVEFRPAVDGRVSRPTAVYQRMPALGPNPSMRLATQIQPGREGFVVPAGEPLRISRREGSYYVVDTTAQHRIHLPVEVVDVAPEVLRSGRPVTLPPPSSGGAVQGQAGGTQAPPSTVAPPMNGPLIGRLRIPLTLDGRVLAAGSYVQVGYDAGTEWVIGMLMPQDAPRVSKAAIELVDRMFYTTPLLGRARRATSSFVANPDLRRDPTHLLQSSPGLVLNPRLTAGQEVNIRAREGDMFEIIPIVTGHRSLTVRVRSAEIEIIHGDPNSGKPVIVPEVKFP